MLHRNATTSAAALALGFLSLPVSAFAQGTVPTDPITSALVADPEIAAYNEHLVFLASPFLDGRLPGTRGMEIAKDYVEHWFAEHEMQPGFGGSYRQEFELAARAKLVGQSFSAPGTDLVFEAGEDYGAVRFGSGGSFEGPAVFIGYSVSDGPDGYTNFPDGLDLSGKVAVMYRFEPMNADGNSRWSDRGWSGKAQFDSKVNAAKDAGAAAIVLLNPPDSSDQRTQRLVPFNVMEPVLDGPAIGLSIDAGTRLLEGLGHSAAELKRMADEDGGYLDLGATLALGAEIESNTTTAENVGGLLPGKGALAEELIVIGGHLDHLGMGEFGSRSGPGELHPGADDNASGAAALILLARRLKARYDALPDDAEARSILLLAFSAEESGLYGSRHYVNNPIRPLEQHAVMINFDMIGRIEDNRLAVTGVETAKGMADMLQPRFDESPLDIQTSRRGGGGSDHLPFLQRRVPALFAILADIGGHPDYHKPGDTSDKINRVAAVQTVDLFEHIAFDLGTHPGSFEFSTGNDAEASAPTAPPRMPRVRLGVVPAPEEGDGLGILIADVSPDSSASEAGMLAGDLLIRWDGAKIDSLNSWMERLLNHEPGDEVKVGIKRDGEELTLTVKLRAR